MSEEIEVTSNQTADSYSIAKKITDWIADDGYSEEEFDTLLQSSTKMKTMLSLMMTFAFSRVSRMTDFIEESEKALFDPSVVTQLDDDQLVERYKLATSNIVVIIETIRKYLSQNKGPGEKEEEMDRLHRLLLDFPKHKLREFAEYLERTSGNLLSKK